MAAYTYLNMVYFNGSQVRISKSLFISVSEGCFYDIKHNADTDDYAALVTKFHIYKKSCPRTVSCSFYKLIYKCNNNVIFWKVEKNDKLISKIIFYLSTDSNYHLFR